MTNETGSESQRPSGRSTPARARTTAPCGSQLQWPCCWRPADPIHGPARRCRSAGWPSAGEPRPVRSGGWPVVVVALSRRRSRKSPTGPTTAKRPRRGGHVGQSGSSNPGGAPAGEVLPCNVSKVLAGNCQAATEHAHRGGADARSSRSPICTSSGDSADHEGVTGRSAAGFTIKCRCRRHSAASPRT